MNIHPFPKNKMSQKLAVLIVLFSTLITLLITAFQVFLEYRHDVSLINKNISHIQGSLLPSLINSVWVQNKTQIVTQINGMLNLGDIEHVGIYISNTVQWEAGNIVSFRIIEKKIPLHYFYNNENRRIGTLKVVASLDNVLQRLRDRVLVILASNAVKTFVVASFILLIFQATVTKHLTRMAHFLTQTDPTQSPEQLSLDRMMHAKGENDELDQLVSSINQNRTRLRDSYSSLKASEKNLKSLNQELETRVEERTASLRKRENDLRKAQKIAHMGSWVENLTTGTVTWSNEHFRILGFEPGEVTPGYDALLSTVPPENRENILDAISLARSQGTPCNCDFRIIRPDGSSRYVNTQTSMEYDDNGTPINMTGSLLDITERREAEEQLIQSVKLASLGEMAAGMAHEINQPLNIIRLAISNLERKSAKGTLTEGIFTAKMKRMTTQVERADKIISHVRVFSRKEDEKTELFDLRNIVTNSLDMTGEQLSLSSIEFSSDLPGTPLFLKGHQIKLEQVCINLINNARNAIEHTRNDGTGKILISLRCDGKDTAIIEVTDNGGGIPQAALKKVFEPFFTTKEVGMGTGLGLSISYGIVNSMGGEIGARNTDDGATFQISLPLVGT